MTRSYTDLAETVGPLIAAAMLERESDWESAESADRRVFRVLMMCGLVAARLILAALAEQFESEAKEEGFTGERRSTVGWMTLFGVVDVVSVYLRKPGERDGRRPMKERLGVTGGGQTAAVERALTDFGIDESFGAAAVKFEEHYGIEVHRTTIRRTVFRLARGAGAFSAERLSGALATPSPHQVLVQADGANAPMVVYRSNPTAPGAERARQLRNHLTRFEDAVNYDDFIDQGLVVGSGEVESGHRHLTQRRLKIAGAWWAEESIEPIAALRCIRANGWWGEFCCQAA